MINYSLPSDAAVYLHCSGRTGRIGKEGRCISLIGGSDFSTRKTLETKYNMQFTLRTFPDPEVIVAHRVERQAKQIREAMGSIIFESYLPTVRALKERPDGDALLAAALRTFFNGAVSDDSATKRSIAWNRFARPATKSPKTVPTVIVTVAKDEAAATVAPSRSEALANKVPKVQARINAGAGAGVARVKVKVRARAAGSIHQTSIHSCPATRGSSC